MKSIFQEEKECWLCHTTRDLHKHHIYGGANRRISEDNGFTVWLCGRHHNLSDDGIHFNKDFDTFVKQKCQSIYEQTHSREEFMSLIGRNYLDD